MSLSYQITRFHIAVPLTEKQWDRLNELENHWLHDEHPPNENPIGIHEALESVGAENVEWGGHYGRYIFFECGADWTASDCGQSIAKTVCDKLEQILKDHS